MSHWRIRQRYGFGAGKVLLRPQLHRHPARTDGLLSGARRAGWEMWIGTDSLVRRALMAAPVLFLSLVLLGMLVLNIFLVPMDRSDIQLVMLEHAAPLPRLEPELVEEPPAPTPEPPAPTALLPEPAPPALVSRQSPTRPAEVKIAAVAPPPELKPDRVRPQPSRRPMPRPQPAPRAQVRIDALPPAERAAPPQPTQRRSVALPSVDPASRPKLDLVAAASTPLPEELEAPPRPTRQRAFVPMEVTPSRNRPVATLQPIPAQPDTNAAAPRQRARTARPQLVDRSRTRPPSSLPTAAHLPIAISERPTPQEARAGRTVRRSQPEPRAVTNERSMHASALHAPAVQPPAASVQHAVPAARAARLAQASPSPGSTRSGSDATLTGVPLGSLAACLSDREEDSLKEQLVAAVTTQQECISSAGTYRFMETKNLNAFLMWIERASGRREADRCEELRLALACLAAGEVR